MIKSTVKSYRPTRIDHFPKSKEGGNSLTTWLENHGLPVSKDNSVNVDTMLKATGGK